jgi:glycosyltransferase involved in cell wall biosynthesis
MKITVGIPFFNCESTLADAIRSVFAQTREDWELILLDDGSRDGSLAIANAVQDDRVRVVSDGVNRGLVARLNQLAELARGEYFVRMDADDLMHPLRLERQIGLLDERTDLDGVAGGAWLIDSQMRVRSKRCCGRREFSGRELLVGRGPVHPTVVMRKTWIETHPYDADYFRAEDVELWCRAFAGGSFAFTELPEALLFYREDHTVNASKIVAGYRTNSRIIKRYGPRLIGRRRTYLELGRSQLKQYVCRLLCAAGQSKTYLALRAQQPITPVEKAAAMEVLHAVRQTPVPGFACKRVTETIREEVAAVR